jgi:ABC-type multidrug transport system permease subunit
MKLSNLYLLNTLVAFVFALGLLLGPTTVLQLFGLSTGNTEKLLAQLFGASLGGFGLLSWYAKDFTDQKAQEGAALSLFITNVIAFIVSILAVFSKAWRSGGWIAVIIFLIFAAGFGYFQFIGPKE